MRYWAKWIWVLVLPQLAAAEPTLLERDFRALLRPVSLGGVALAFGAAGLAHGLDDEFSGRVDNPVLEPVLDFGNFYAGTTTSMGAATGLWLFAKTARMDEVRQVSAEVLRGLVLANALVGPLKYLAGRERPDGSNDYSFPSGHSANAFAISAVLSRRYGKKVGVPLYALASFVPVARIHDRHHFFSDVVAGAILGTVAGFAVNGEGENLVLVPAHIGGTRLLQVRWRY
jgi:membrane-associated phospholipid phosphatase